MAPQEKSMTSSIRERSSQPLQVCQGAPQHLASSSSCSDAGTPFLHRRAANSLKDRCSLLPRRPKWPSSFLLAATRHLVCPFAKFCTSHHLPQLPPSCASPSSPPQSYVCHPSVPPRYVHRPQLMRVLLPPKASFAHISPSVTAATGLCTMRRIPPDRLQDHI